MKITKVDIYMLDAGAQRASRRPICCRVHTDEGIYGDGEAGIAFDYAAPAGVGMLQDLSRLIIGTSVGTVATIVPLTVAAGPYVARIVEISLREMDRGVVEAAQSMGCSPWQIVTKVMLPECRPSLINGATNAAITILGYGAMAGAIGGGGLGAVALMRGHGRNQVIVMYVAVIILVILVQIIQSIGTAWSVKSDRRINPTETKRRT